MSLIEPQSGLFLLLGPEHSYDLESALEATFQESKKITEEGWASLLEDLETLPISKIEDATFQIDIWTSSLASSKQYLLTLRDHLQQVMRERYEQEDDRKRHAPIVEEENPLA